MGERLSEADVEVDWEPERADSLYERPWLPPGFDAKTASEHQIREVVSRLPGKSLSQVVGKAIPVGLRADKGNVGAQYESFFGISRDSDPRPDFRSAGIELKSVPLLRARRGLRVKERTYIGMIDYVRLVSEEWEAASVRKKLDHILFIYFMWERGVDGLHAPTDSFVFWRPDPVFLERCRSDWEFVREKVRLGKAHELSESDGLALRPARKGDGLTRQPRSSQLAHRRAWALKPDVTWAIRLEAQGRAQFESLAESLGVATQAELEDAALRHFHRFVGRTVGEAADAVGVPRSNGYQFKAAVVRRALGARSVKARIREFDQLGIEIKSVRVSPLGRPWDSMSFPAFRYRDLIDQSWEDSDLIERLRRLLVVPLVGATDETPAADCRIAEPFFWSPTVDQLDEIGREWVMYCDEIRSGKADSLTPASKTRFIHVRPHGKNKADVDDAPMIGPVVKKSFWLNDSFVHELVRTYSNTWEQSPRF